MKTRNGKCCGSRISNTTPFYRGVSEKSTLPKNYNINCSYWSGTWRDDENRMDRILNSLDLDEEYIKILNKTSTLHRSIRSEIKRIKKNNAMDFIFSISSVKENLVI